MARVPLIIHERLGSWARQLRPRTVGWPVRIIETRSTADLEAALAHSACPLVLIDLADRPRSGLDDLDCALRTASNALVLVLDSGTHAAAPALARELGAAHVLVGVVPPPAVAGLLARWVPLAQHRSESDGWARAPEPEPEPWDRFALVGAGFTPVARP